MGHDEVKVRRRVEEEQADVKLVRKAHEFEYRDRLGIDRLGRADLWANSEGDRAVLVLKDVESGSDNHQRLTLLENARRALYMLASSLLPFVVPRAHLDVWVLHLGNPGHGEEKPRVLVLP